MVFESDPASLRVDGVLSALIHFASLSHAVILKHVDFTDLTPVISDVWFHMCMSLETSNLSLM